MPHQSTAFENESFKVAVASNFSIVLKKLRVDFKQKTGHDFSISQASTGKLFAQISYGAPYDIFLSADERRPELLQDSGLAESPVVYAQGLLMLVVSKSVVNSCNISMNNALSNVAGKIAIANPKTAPYGYAAKEMLIAYKQWSKIKPRLLSGENIVQAYQFLMSGGADAGILAKSLLQDAHSLDGYCQWDVPTKYYQPIKQKMVLLKRSKDKIAVQQFYRYIQTSEAKKIIRDNGYSIK